MATTEEFKLDASGAKRELDSLIKKMKAFAKEAGLAEEEVDDLVSNVEKGSKKAGSNIEKTSGSFGSLGGAAKVAGAAIVAAFTVERVIEFGKFIKDTEKKFTQLRGEVKRFSNLTGDALDEAVVKTDALANTFGKDLNEVLEASRNLSKQFGISATDALSLIEEGFLQGADANGDFLDKVKEYPIQFKNAGFSAEEFIKVSTQEVKGGVFSDKLVDTLKEADLALKELTKTQQDALTAAFGEEFTQDFLTRISSGQLTTRDAILEIGQAAKSSGLNLQQIQTLTADIFKGAGEDAGGFNEVLNLVNESLDIQLGQYDELGKATKEALTAQEEFSAEQQRLAENFSGISNAIDNFVTRGQAQLLGFFNDLIESVDESAKALRRAKFSLGDIEGKTVEELNEKLKENNEELERRREILDENRKAADKLADESALVAKIGDSYIGASSELTKYANNIEASTAKIKQLEQENKILAEAISQTSKETANESTEISNNSAQTEANIKKKQELAKAEAKLREETAKNAEKLREQAELLIAGGEDSEQGLELLKERALAELNAQLEAIEARKDVENLSAQEIAALRLAVEEEFYNKLVALRDTKTKEANEVEEGLRAERLAEIDSELDAEQLKISEALANEQITRETARELELANLLAFLEEKRNILLADGESTLEIDKQIADARISLNDIYAERKKANDEDIIASAKAVEDAEAQALDATLALVESVGGLFGESGEELTKFIGTFANVTKQFAALASRQAASSAAVTASESSRAVAQSAALPFPANIAAVATTVSTLITAFATISGLFQQNSFSEGTEYVKGRGTETSDSIPAMLSKGERVVSASQNRKYWDVLEMVRAGDLAPEEMLSRLRGDVIAPSSSTVIVNSDSSEIVRAIKGIPKTELYLDESGFWSREKTRNSTVNYLNNRFK